MSLFWPKEEAKRFSERKNAINWLQLVIEGGDADHDCLLSGLSLIQISVTPFRSWPIFCQNLEQSRDVPWICSIMTRMFSFISTIREKWMIYYDSWGYESFPFIGILYNSLQSRLVKADSMKPPQYVARRSRIKFNRRRHEHSCPYNSSIGAFRLFHEILVRRLIPMLRTNMDL
jgi:hypothetical protein